MKTYIYGAGLLAKLVHSYIIVSNQYDNFGGFVVSDINNDKRVVLGDPVYDFSEKEEELKKEDTKIIIAAKGYMARSIESFLNEHGIYSYSKLDYNFCKSICTEILNFYEAEKINDKKILFCNSTGRTYACNMKYIHQYIQEVKPECESVFAVDDLEDKSYPDYVKLVEVYSLEYFKELFTARFFIYNGSGATYVKRTGQIFINTWHGLGPFKKCKLENQKNRKEDPEDTIELENLCDIGIAGSMFNVNFFRDSLGYKGKVELIGYPRNDILVNQNEEIRKKIRGLLGVNEDVLVVLYAPTYRDNMKNSFEHFNLNFQLIQEKLEKKFGKPVVFWGRYHYLIRRYLSQRNFGVGVRDLSDYADSQELLLAADVLISDYSSIMWDFSLQYKPIFTYQDDVDEYILNRDFYAPPFEWPYISCKNSEELGIKIENFDEEKYRKDIKSFLGKYGSLDDGQATEKVGNLIIDIMGE